LHHLTLLPWQDLFPHNSQGLLARHPRWCPACLEEQCREDGEAIFPLVWSLETYQVCRIHLVALESCCSHCGKMQPCIPSCPDLALCAYCRRPLGGARTQALHPSFKIWVAEAVGDMVARQSVTNFAPTRERFQEFVREQVVAHTGGYRAAFCRAVGINEFGVSGWLNKGERPSITQFLTVCYGTKTLPVEIFHASGQPASMTDLRMPAEKLKERIAPPRLDPVRRAAVEQILQEHLNIGAGQSVSVIAKNLGVGRVCLRYWFPGLCKLLSEQHRTMTKKRSDDLQRLQCMLVEEVMSRIQAEGGMPTKRTVDKLLRAKGISLSQSHLMSAFRKWLTLSP
jgi:transposase